MSVVCVTGATGYLAAHIVKLLLRNGHKVKGTVRSLENEQKLRPLRLLPNADECLELVEADMRRPETFVSMLKGCSSLIHTATPIEIPLDGTPPASTWEEAHEKQISPAVDGTRLLLQAAKDVGLRKIVLTSSIGAMRFKRTPPVVLNEECWSDEDFLHETLFTKGPACYALAKTLQEKEAWKFAESEGLNLVVIIPAFIIGPALTPHLNFSLEALQNLVQGKGTGLDSCRLGTIPDVYKGIVDVREAAQAHILALENDHAKGRYLLQSSIIHYADVAATMRKHPNFQHFSELPLDTDDGSRHAVLGRMDNTKMRELGVEFIPIERSIVESIDSLVAGGFAPKITPTASRL